MNVPCWWICAFTALEWATNAEKLPFVASLNCFRNEMEHLCCITSSHTTEDQFFQTTHPGLSIIVDVVASNKHPFLVAESPFLVVRPHGLYVLRGVRISLNLRRFQELLVPLLYLLFIFCIHYIFYFLYQDDPVTLSGVVHGII